MGRFRNAPAVLALVAIVGLGASACAGGDDDSAVDAPSESATPAPGARAGEEFATTDGDAAADTTASASIGLPLLDGRALATTAGVTVSTSDIRQAADDTLASVARNNAAVFNADVNIGSELDDGSIDGSGWFVVKVPPADLEPLIADLGATVGTVSGRTQETSDVTDQLVDLEIRIGVERDVIDRFRQLLGEATAFQDIVDIERVIAERTIALEQLLASQRNLENRVELSTLTINLQYVPPADEGTDRAGDDTIGDAWRAGWDAFAGALFVLAFALAVAFPFLAAAVVVAGTVWLVLRRQRRIDDTTPADSAGEPLVSRPDETLVGPTRQG